MSIFFNKDLLYNILSHAELPTIGMVFRVNKIINDLHDNKHFWKGKFINDCNHVIPKSDNWLCEYKHVLLLRKMAIEFLDILNKNVLYTKIRLGYDPQTRNFHWLPLPHILKHINEFESKEHIIKDGSLYFEKYMPPDNFGFMISFRNSKILDNRHCVEETAEHATRESMITCITRLSYDCENLVLEDNHGNEFLFSDKLILHMNDGS